MSKLAGGCVVVVLAGAAVAVIASVAPGAAILGLWAVGLGALWQAVRKVPDGSHSPPPPDPLPSDTKPQFRSVSDTDNPHRTHVVWDTEEGTPP